MADVLGQELGGGRQPVCERTTPFNADRIVVAVSCVARDTAIIETLHELQERDASLGVDLWDRQEVSDRLRNQPGIVEIFFGGATAASFCGTAVPQAPVAPHSIAADAILRGPIAHLGLGPDLQTAEAAMVARPEEAAHLFGQIARRLETEGFGPHAGPIRTLEAQALTKAGRNRDAANVRPDLGWQYLNSGDAFSAQVQIREIAEWKEAGEDTVRRANALSLSGALRHHHSVTLDEVAATFDAVAGDEDDPHRADAALVLAEEAVAARRSDIVATRTATLLQIADALPASGLLSAARIRMCVADAGGDWPGPRRRRARHTHQVSPLSSWREALAISRWPPMVRHPSLGGSMPLSGLVSIT